MHSVRYFFIGIVIVLLTFVGLELFFVIEPVVIDETIIEIKDGETASQIANKLFDKGIIKSKFLFKCTTKLTGDDKNLKRGKYLFSGKITLANALQKIQKGKVQLKKITVPEGLTVFQTMRHLSGKGFGEYKNFRKLVFDSLFVKELTGFEVSSLEGFLYPETYFLPYEASERFVLKQMVKQFFKQTAPLNFDPPENLSFYEVLILASIVEEEARVQDEKPTIASVYLNRLHDNHKLDADPTVAYALRLRRKKRKKIYYKDLKIDSPYNTYKRVGLPPTPICSPSVSAIQAVLAPAETDYYFFFADKGGRHTFSETYRQHLNKLNIKRRKNGS